ncbi:hypothetical protein INR49_015344 [Caranx melampygus]|nr:hypothetical protein INR49_015344 [Caranx melampygus]
MTTKNSERSTDCAEAAAPAPKASPSSGALYRLRPESSCHSPGPGGSVRARAIDRTMDRGLAGLALYPLKFTAAFMLSLNMEDRPVVIAMFLNVQLE